MQTFMSPPTAKTERRKKLRKKPLRLVYIELANGNGGMMRDLSEEGFAVRAMMPLRAGDPTPFSFTLGDTMRIQGEGRVLWVAEAGRVAGVAFTQITPDLKSQIDDWLIEDEKIVSPREPAKEPVIAQAATMEELREELRLTPVRSDPSEPPAEEQAEKRSEKPEMETSAGAARLEESKPAPRSVNEPSAAPVASVNQGLFRNWSKSPPEATPPAQRRDLDRAAPLPTIAPPAPSGARRRAIDERPPEEDEEVPVDVAPPLPDISDVLIQPRGMSTDTTASSVAVPRLPEIRELEREGRAPRESFTLGRAVLTMVALTIFVAAFVYHREVGQALIWLGEAMGGTSSGALNPSSATREVSNDSVGVAANPSRPSLGRDAGAASELSAQTGNAPSSLPAGQKGTTAPLTPLAGITPPSSPEASPDAGQSEYLRAVQILRGTDSAAGMPEAVRLLWIAVEKGNPGAEVTLADLYWHGQGVVKNCDQTRILLTAAARKGSEEAQKRLQQFQQQGCE
jgi:hypothetical protein